MARRPKRKFKPGDTLDRFRLENRLGAGAYGQVWLALDEGAYGFRKHVALKILTEAGNPRREEALLREARICGALNHPNVVDVYGVMRVDEVPFIIMEYVEGETLSSLWRDLEFLNLRFPRSVILELGIAVSEALHHAWTATDSDGTDLLIVHRDLKPANIMVSNRGIAKVADFGIAKVAPDLSTTRTGKLKGTPSYMPPELWMGRRDFRPPIDLWSLGIILWELAAGRRFYGNAAMMDIPDLITKRDPAAEAAEIEDFFPALTPIVERLLQRDLNARYATGIELAEELRRVRSRLGAAGDLMQFIRLVRAGRLDPSDRKGSLAALPTIPEGADDWEPLIDLAEPKTDADVPAPLVDSFVNIEPVAIPDLSQKGLREMKRAVTSKVPVQPDQPTRTAVDSLPDGAAESLPPEPEPAPDRTAPSVDPDGRTVDGDPFDSDETAASPSRGLPHLPSWGLSSSAPSLAPRRRTRRNMGSLSGVHNVPPSLGRSPSFEERAKASAEAESSPKLRAAAAAVPVDVPRAAPVPTVESGLSEAPTQRAVMPIPPPPPDATPEPPEDVLPRTQSVDPMIAAPPPAPRSSSPGVPWGLVVGAAAVVGAAVAFGVC